MKRSIYAGLLILTLATVAAIATAPDLSANEPLAEGRALQADGATEATAVSPAPEAADPLCPSGAGFDLGVEALQAPFHQPQVGSPCCDSLCAQICGVGEPCACKRCQVLGCGV